VVGVGPEHERRAALLDPVARLGDAFGEECVVPQVPARIARVQSEEHRDRQSELVPGADRAVERGIVEPALGALHPVDDAAARGIGLAVAADSDARIALLRCDQPARFTVM